jgi:3-dehydroquinate dehydratase-2
MYFLVVNGPNLDLLGTREPDVYGSTTLEDLEALIEKWAATMGSEADCVQSNGEGEIIDLIHGFGGDGIVINPGAFTHTSHAIADAIRGVGLPSVEVHISNVRQREPWRAHSFIAPACVRTIYGRGIIGYRDAMRHLLNRSALPFQTVRYGPHADNVGELRRGGDELVVFAHGGLWRHEYERDTTESLAVDLAGRGVGTWNIEYRRFGDGGGWPASGHDVLTALDAIPQLGLDPRRVVVVGHSAGSQLLMWAAQRTRVPTELHVALGPLLDLQAAIEHSDPGAEEARRLIESGAPADVDPGGVETVLVHGDADQIVPVSRSVALALHLGIEHHHTSSDHFSLLDPTKPEWQWVLNRIR